MPAQRPQTLQMPRTVRAANAVLGVVHRRPALVVGNGVVGSGKQAPVIVGDNAVGKLLRRERIELTQAQTARGAQ